MKQQSRSAMGALLLLCAMNVSGRNVPTGVFSNGGDGFGAVMLMVHEAGCAYLHTSVAPLVGTWTFDEESSVMRMEVIDPGNNEMTTQDFAFDANERCFEVVGEADALVGEAEARLCQTTNAIPDAIVRVLLAYPESVKEHRARLQYIKDQKDLRAREEPELQRLLQTIKEGPHAALFRDCGVASETPAACAFETSLADRSTEIPDDLLRMLLDRIPPENHGIPALIMSRPELSADTIRSYYPKAVDLGVRLNNIILFGVANHANTPRDILVDIAGRKDLPVIVLSTANQRLGEAEGTKAEPAQ